MLYSLPNELLGCFFWRQARGSQTESKHPPLLLTRRTTPGGSSYRCTIVVVRAAHDNGLD